MGWNGMTYVADETEAGRFRVHRRAFLDVDVLERERRRIFDRSWLYLGHESEVEASGEFRARDVGGRPILFVRGHDGVVRAFLNACRHRGAQVCREHKGKAKSFQCFYHGWTYSSEGRLIGVPDEEGYGRGFSRETMGLSSPPRMESYRGFYFVNFDPNCVSLHDYLAGAREYLDLVADQSAIGMEIVGGTQSYAIHANWKLLVENSYDGYHAQIAHVRYLKYLASSGAVGLGDAPPVNRAVDLGNGHAVVEYLAPWGRPIAHWVRSFGESTKAEIAALRAGLEERLGAERARRISTTSRNLVVFPNLVINDIMAITVRTFYPVTPDRMHVDAWSLAPKNEAPEHRRHRLENFLTFLGPGGFATPDDIEALESCQAGYRATAEDWNDISREMERETPSVIGEHQMRTFWREWRRILLGEPGKRGEVSDVHAV
jgi:p-cumate 2,3-dioxygenase subunit alpha